VAEEIRCYERRAHLIGGVLGRIGFKPIHLIELEDPQYQAMARLEEELGPGLAMAAAVLAALVSYRLPVRGEEWWTRLSNELARKRPPSLAALASVLKDLLASWRVPLWRQKISRIERALASPARSVLEKLMLAPERFPWEADKLYKSLARGLRQRAGAKTIAFSIKMAYYVYKAHQRLDKPFLGVRIPMPVDSRVACLTLASRLCDAREPRILVSRPQPAQRVWDIVADQSGIPALHLDALAWRLGWIPRDHPTIEKARSEAFRMLSAYMEGEQARKLSFILIERLCQR
jgi:DNA-(apurinic or apyrimidinic site) lyase